MKRTLQIALLASALVALAIGCVGPRPEPEAAVFCPKCKMVWVEMPDLNDPYRLSTVSTEVMECPDCENAVVHFFKTGELEHACSTCGGELVHCTSH